MSLTFCANICSSLIEVVGGGGGGGGAFTVTLAVAVWLPPAPLSIDTSVALVVWNVSVADWPLSMVSGFAVRDAVGAAGGGGGGGGGGGCFLWHAPRNRIALSANSRAKLLSVSCFNFSSRILVP